MTIQNRLVFVGSVKNATKNGIKTISQFMNNLPF